MHFPAIDDTIVAVSTGWAPMPIGVVRLSGPESFKLVESLDVSLPAAVMHPTPHWSEVRVRVDPRVWLPAIAYWFPHPRSYTGQDLVELHTVGALPLLRELSAKLIERGARRALPGEFTARAFLAGKLNAEQVEGVLAILQGGRELADRQTVRESRAACERLVADVRERIVDLLAMVEASIDFVDEDDVPVVTPADALSSIDMLLENLADLRRREQREPLSGRPHVALAGLPNAGKSSLFNALLGRQRAMVSPTLGTTRDVLSAEIEVGGVPIILQDCAGLGESEDELELAAHRSAEQAAAGADLVLWVHAVDKPWLNHEMRAVDRIPVTRRVLVSSKGDLSGCELPESAGGFADAVRTSAATGDGLRDLGQAICRRLSGGVAFASGALGGGRVSAALASLERARGLIAAGEVPSNVSNPELLALELRAAHARLPEHDERDLVEDLLGRVFSQLCVGK
jgi:tRNA modification GTPase